MSSQFTPEKIRASLEEKGFYSVLAEKWDTFGAKLDVPRDAIRHALTLDQEAKLDKILHYVVEKHPFGSWRLLIWALDCMPDCIELADTLRLLAEPAEQSLTCDEVMAVLKEAGFSGMSKDWLEPDHLADTLLIPAPQKEAILYRTRSSSVHEKCKEVITYWCNTLYNASWATLAGALYYLREKERVIEKVKARIPSAPQYSQHMTCEELQEAAKEVDQKNCDNLRKLLNIPHKVGRLDLRYVPDSDIEKKKKSIFDDFVANHPSASWRQFAHALYRLGEHRALQDIYAKHLPCPDKLRRYDAYQRAMEAEGYHNQIVMQGIMAGLPRSGKSSLMAKLTHKKVAVNQPSTGVAERVVPVNLSITRHETQEPAATTNTSESTCTATAKESYSRLRHQSISVTEAMRWESTESLREEVAIIIDRIYSSLRIRNSDENSKSNGSFAQPLKSPTKTMDVVFPPPLEQKTKPGKSPKSSFLNFFRRRKVSRSAISPTPRSLDASLSESFSSFSEDTLDIVPEIEVLWTLYMSDAGGQPEFQDLLAAVVSGPSLFFVVFPLHWDLNKHYAIDYLDEGKKAMQSYESSLTLREALLQLLASIASTGIVTGDGRKIQPKVLFIGTHKDQLHPDALRQKMIADKDHELQQMVRATKAMDENMVIFASQSQMIFTVDNTQPDDHIDFKMIRSTINRIGNDQDSVYKVRIPYTWMLLSVAIRHVVEKYNTPVIPYEECFKLAQDVGIKNKDDFNDALWFLHVQLGIIRHYQDIPALRNSIISDPQHIYNKITTVIKATFTFENCPIKRGTLEEFQKKGIFERADLIKLLTTGSEDITPEQLLALLEHLDITAPFQRKGKSQKYFLPCALQHAKKCSSSLISEKCFDSLLFTFKQHGYCPKGIFGALVVDILKQMPELHNNHWMLDKDTIYRNQFSMFVGPYSDKFTFSLLPDCIRIDAYPSKRENRKILPNEVCSHVRSQVEKSLTCVANHLNYNDGAKHSVAFICPDSSSASSHPAIAMFSRSGELCSLICSRHEEVRHQPINKNHHIWFHSERDPLLPPLGDLLTELEPIAYRWELLAVQLGLRESFCKNISHKLHGRPDSPTAELREILSKWYSTASSLDELVQALTKLDESVLAASLTH